MSTNNQTNDGSKSRLLNVSNEQKQKLKKYAVFALMGIICTGSIFYIFSPSAEDEAKKEQSGFNAEIPMPKEGSLISDKRDAYEQEQMKQKQSERMRSLQDFSALLGDNAPKTDGMALITEEPQLTVQKISLGNDPQRQSPIQNSTMAYRDINRSLGSFYERPREDPEKERLKQELEELKKRMEETENRKSVSDDHQLELMEKQFQLASKYMPGMSGTTATLSANAAEPASASTTSTTNGNVLGKAVVTPVAPLQEQPVSALQAEMSDMEFFEMFSQPRNMGFLTVTDETKDVQKNTIFACVHNDQTVMNGQTVRLRLLEAIKVGKMHIPRNTLISGTAKIQGERLEITVNTLENDGTVLAIGLTVYDLDGITGIFIPNMQELNAAKEIVANMGTNAGTSINLSNDAGQQFAADMGRNVIQGVSQFTAKKLREVKVHLKAGYKVYLIPEGLLKTNNQPSLANR